MDDAKSVDQISDGKMRCGTTDQEDGTTAAVVTVIESGRVIAARKRKNGP